MKDHYFTVKTPAHIEKLKPRKWYLLVFKNSPAQRHLFKLDSCMPDKVPDFSFGNMREMKEQMMLKHEEIPLFDTRNPDIPQGTLIDEVVPFSKLNLHNYYFYNLDQEDIEKIFKEEVLPYRI